MKTTTRSNGRDGVGWSGQIDWAVMLADEIRRLDQTLAGLSEKVERLDERRAEIEAWTADLLPAANGALEVATRRLDELERSGAIALAGELARALETASTVVDPDDVRAIGARAGLLARTVRAAGAPEITAVAERASEAVSDARKGRPPGLWTLFRRMRKPHVRRGVAVALEILEALGEGVPPDGAPSRPEAAADRLSPPPSRSPRQPLPTPRPRAHARPLAGAATAPAASGRGANDLAAATLLVGGQPVALDGDGFLADPRAWTRELAEALATRAGIGPLTAEHWRVIEFCREHAGETFVAPGLRFITKELGVAPREMYRLFPGGPGVQAALVAGLGKPRSCV